MASVQKRGEASFRITVSCGYNKEGEKQFKSKTINLSHLPEKKRQEEAEKQAILFEDEVKNGLFLDSGKMSFEDFIDKWLTDYANINLAPKTLARYIEIIDRIRPTLGHIKLNKLQPTHLNKFYNMLREEGIRKDKKAGGLSERTILHHHRVISTMLTAAVQWQLILSNPAERIKPPKVEKKEAKHFDEDQVEYIFELLENEPLKYKVMIYLAVFSGMRLGELDGIEWKDIDFDNKTMTIRQASQYLPGQGTFTKSTKNTSSNRIVSLPDSLITLLRLYKVWQNGVKADLDNLWQGKPDEDRLFTQNNGKPIYPSTPSVWFNKFIKRHNNNILNDSSIPTDKKETYLLPEVNFHGLRHTNASLLIASGCDITTVSKRLGHARTSTTTDIYSHSLRKADIGAADKLENMFNKKNKIPKQG